MDARQAATELRDKLGRPDWLTSIGVGTVAGIESIMLYVVKDSPTALDLAESGWHGIPVVVRTFGAISPIRGHLGALGA
jgi:hypothetical protein